MAGPWCCAIQFAKLSGLSNGSNASKPLGRCMPRNLIIAIDGPVASGKSTLARRVADMLGYVYIDSGAMYRAVALKALRGSISLEGSDDMVSLARGTRIDLRSEGGVQRVSLDGEDVTS